MTKRVICVGPTLQIPEKQFTAIYVKKRSRKKRFRKNFMGICLINYRDSAVRKEILELGRALHGIMTRDALSKD
jgi:hypothetical protein